MSSPAIASIISSLSALQVRTIISSLVALVVAIEGQGEDTPAAVASAFRLAVRRKGVDLAEAGGLDAMAAGMAAVLYHAPDKAESRQAYLTAAWAGLTPDGGPGSLKP